MMRLEKRVLTGHLKDRNKIERQIDRIQASHPQVTDLYTINVEDNVGTPKLAWKKLEERDQWRQRAKALTCCERLFNPKMPNSCRRKYTQIAEVEAALRTLNTQLKIRPFSKQLE